MATQRKKNVKSQQKKRGRGRPTKYEGDKTIQKVWAFTKRMSKTKVFAFSNYALAVELGITYDCLLDWMKDKAKQEFFHAVKNLETRRAALAIERIMGDNFFPAGKAAFLLKNWTDMHDRRDINVETPDLCGVMVFGRRGKMEFTPEEWEEEVAGKANGSDG